MASGLRRFQLAGALVAALLVWQPGRAPAQSGMGDCVANGGVTLNGFYAVPGTRVINTGAGPAGQVQTGYNHRVRLTATRNLPVVVVSFMQSGGGIPMPGANRGTNQTLALRAGEQREIELGFFGGRLSDDTLRASLRVLCSAG